MSKENEHMYGLYRGLCSKCKKRAFRMPDSNIWCVNCVKYQRNQLRTNMFKRFQEFREKKLFTDIIFEGKTGRTFHCHQIILGTTTDYIEALVRNKLAKENDIDKTIRVDLEKIGIDETNFENLLDIVYKNQFDFGDNFVDLLFNASSLLMEDVVCRIECFILKNQRFSNILIDENFFKLCCIPTLSDRPVLQDYLKECLLKHFKHLSSLPEFFDLSYDIMCNLSIFNDPRLFYSPETQVNFIGKWIFHDNKSRLPLVEKIVKSINTGDNIILESSPKISNLIESMENPIEKEYCLKKFLGGFLLEPIRKQFEELKIHRKVVESKKYPDYKEWIWPV